MENNTQSKKVSTDITRTGKFKEDATGVYFEYDPAMSSGNNPAPAGRLNEAHVLLAFSHLVYREVAGRKMKIRIIIEEE